MVIGFELMAKMQWCYRTKPRIIAY